jgi:hypothetical protein
MDETHLLHICTIHACTFVLNKSRRQAMIRDPELNPR